MKLQHCIPSISVLFFLFLQAKFLESEASIVIRDVFYSSSMTYLLIKKTNQDVKVTYAHQQFTMFKSPIILYRVTSLPIHSGNVIFLGWNTFGAAYSKQQTHERNQLYGSILHFL